MKLTTGNWKVSTVALGTVVTDRFPIDFPQDKRHKEIQWYGGHCIAESIQNGGDAELFAHSKQLLKAATAVRTLINNFMLLKNEPAVKELNVILDDIYKLNQTSQCNKPTTSTG